MRARVALILSTLVVALIGVPSAQAATIPTQPAACHPTPPTPGIPKLTSFGINPSVDVTVHAKNIRVTVHATDATKDITQIFVELRSEEVGNRSGDRPDQPQAHLGQP